METGCYCFVGCLTGWLVAWKPVTKPLIRKKIISTVEKKGPERLGGCAVMLKDVDFQIGSKLHVKVSGLVVANPEGWKSESLLTVGHVCVQVNVCAAICSAVKALGKPKELMINHLDLDVLKLTWEKSLTISNIKDMQDRMRAAKKKEEGEDDDISYLAIPVEADFDVSAVDVSAAQEHATNAADVGAHADAAKNASSSVADGAQEHAGNASAAATDTAVTVNTDNLSKVPAKPGFHKPDFAAFKREKKKRMKILVQKLEVKGVTAEIIPYQMTTGVTVAAADILYDDFSAKNNHPDVGKLIEILVGSVVASVEDNASSLAENPLAILNGAADSTTGWLW